MNDDHECECVPGFLETSENSCVSCEDLQGDLSLDDSCSCVPNATPDDHGICHCDVNFERLVTQIYP